ncbi:LutC/YkgG family protein [Cellulomonas denverensis]|uniref:LUD domain-containing protein n=1 Tax=Cellulomonas denverensis TaxID=264297 RepID=A0A7X6KUW1_9CELL|nr:LUD domain-containing protein [Cellulomonas denverensis]NKY22265.1 LUD domain-containing protein [Cellulomonas denverensis]GIG26932.1 lactate utilization protein C [Cellulomonas denverensis]
MDARTDILARIRLAQTRAGVTEDDAAAPERRYRTGSELDPGAPALIDLLRDRLLDYRAHVHRAGPDPATTLAGLLPADGTVVVPAGLPEAWDRAVRAATDRVVVDAPTLSHDDLDRAAAVVTGARLAIAETGVLVLDGSADQGRRAITLVPDHHVCLLRRDQVVGTVPEAVAILGEHPERPTTWIAGPSATSDIELVRVEGVHGPRRLDVVLIG